MTFKTPGSQIFKVSKQHGEWLPWLKQQQESGAIGFSHMTATKYMRLATNINRDLYLPETTSIRAALELLSDKEPEAEQGTLLDVAAERKAFAAEVGRICQNLNGLSNEGGLSNLDKSWLVDIAEKIGQTRQTLHNWWSAFCKETGLTITPKQANDENRNAFFCAGCFARAKRRPSRFLAQPGGDSRRARMEEGKHAAESGMDLKAYAEKSGKERKNLQNKLHAWRVLSVSHVGHAEVSVSPRARGSRLNAPNLGVPHITYLGGVLFLPLRKIQWRGAGFQLCLQGWRKNRALPGLQLPTVGFSPRRNQTPPPAGLYRATRRYLVVVVPNPIPRRCVAYRPHPRPRPAPSAHGR